MTLPSPLRLDYHAKIWTTPWLLLHFGIDSTYIVFRYKKSRCQNILEKWTLTLRVIKAGVIAKMALLIKIVTINQFSFFLVNCKHWRFFWISSTPLGKWMITTLQIEIMQSQCFKISQKSLILQDCERSKLFNIGTDPTKRGKNVNWP